MLVVSAGAAVATGGGQGAPSNSPQASSVRQVVANEVLAGALRRQRAISRDADRGGANATAMALSRREAQRLVDRRAEALGRLRASSLRRAQILERSTWSSPLEAYVLTARFGDVSSLWSTTHTGIDLAAPTGSPIRAVAAGVVTSAGYAGPYGLKVVVEHPDETQAWYAHMSSIAVGVGDEVKSGSVLGLVGATGNVTGPHLHLEIRPGGLAPTDPIEAWRARGVQL